MRSFFTIFPLALLLTIISHAAKAQGMDPVFSQFYAAPIYLNPAFAGSTTCSRIALSQRLISGPENFHIANFSYDSYVEALHGGVGLMVTSDQSNMYMMRNSINAMYAYHLRLTDDLELNFGVQAGYVRNDSRWHRFKFPVDEPDTIAPIAGNNVDFAAGMMLFSDAFYGGFAVHHLHEPDMSLFSESSAPLQRKHTLHLGFYREPVWGNQRMGRDAPEYFFSPNLIFQLQGNINDPEERFSHVSLGMYAGRKPLMIGAWYRYWIETGGAEANPTVVFLLGINIDDYRIGLSYDYSDVFFNVLELTFAMRFNCP